MKKFITKYLGILLSVIITLNSLTEISVKSSDDKSYYVYQEIADYDFEEEKPVSPLWKSSIVTSDGNTFLSLTGNSSTNSALKNDFKKITGILEISYDMYTNYDGTNANFGISAADTGGGSPKRLIYVGKEGNIVSPCVAWSEQVLENNTWYTLVIRVDYPNKTMSVRFRKAADSGAFTEVDLGYYDETGKVTKGKLYPFGGTNKELPDNFVSLSFTMQSDVGKKAYVDNFKVVEYKELEDYKTLIHENAFENGVQSPTASWDKVQGITADQPWSYIVNSENKFVTLDMDIYDNGGSYTIKAGETVIFSKTGTSILNNGKYSPHLYTQSLPKWHKLRFTLDKEKAEYNSFIKDGSKYFEVNGGALSTEDSFTLSISSGDTEIYVDDIAINDVASLSVAFNMCTDIQRSGDILDYAYAYGLLNFPIGYAALNDSQKESLAGDMLTLGAQSDAQSVLDDSIYKLLSAMTGEKAFVYDYDFRYGKTEISSLKLAVSGEVTKLTIDNTSYSFSTSGNIITVDEAIDLAGREELNICITADGAEHKILAKCGGFTAENTDFNYYPGWTRKAITFSLDDGNIKQDKVALGYLNAAGIKGTFNLIGSSVDKNTNPAELRELYEGHEIGNHGYHHIRAIPSDASMSDYVLNADGFYYKGTTPYLDAEGFKLSMDKGKETIEKVFGEGSVKSFAWPFGRGAAGKNQDIIDKAKADYSNLRHAINLEISKSKYFSHPVELADWEDYKEWNVSSLDTDLTSKYKAYRDLPDDGRLKLFTLGMHSSDYNNNNTWSAMESFCRDMGNRPELYWYATNTEIIDYGLYTKEVGSDGGLIANNSSCDLYFISEGKKYLAPANSVTALALCFGNDTSRCDMSFSKDLDTITDSSNMAGDLIHGYGNKKLSEISYTVSEGASVEVYTPNGVKITDTQIEAYPGIMFKCTSGDKKYTKTYTLGYSDICIYAPFVDITGEEEGKTLNVSLQMRAFTPSGKTYSAYAAAYKDGELIALNKGDLTIPKTVNSYKTYKIEGLSVNAAGADSYKVMVFDEKLVPVMKNSYADTSLSGKKILFLGDSITGISDAGYPKYIASLYGAEVYNGGISGTTLAKGEGELYEYFSLANIADMLTGKISEADISKIDTWSASYLDSVGRGHYNNVLKKVGLKDMEYLSIFYGTNDFNRLTALGDIEDKTDVNTVKGALSYAIDSFRSAKPDLKIVVFTPLYRDRMLTVDGIRDGKNSDDYPNSDGVYLRDYCKAIEEVCTEYGIPCYNLYELSTINKLNSKYYLNDGLHPSEPNGRNYLGQLIGQCIAEAY